MKSPSSGVRIPRRMSNYDLRHSGRADAKPLHTPVPWDCSSRENRGRGSHLASADHHCRPMTRVVNPSRVCWLRRFEDADRWLLRGFFRVKAIIFDQMLAPEPHRLFRGLSGYEPVERCDVVDPGISVALSIGVNEIEPHALAHIEPLAQGVDLIVARQRAAAGGCNLLDPGRYAPVDRTLKQPQAG